MSASETTFYRIKTLHRVFAAASLALLAAVVWMVAADYTRDWKGYQRTFRDEVEPWDTEAALRQQEFDEQPGERDRLERLLAQQRPSFGKWLLSLPLIDALGRPLAIDQVWLPELPLRHPFGETPRIDRCPTCHQGIERAPGAAASAVDSSLPARGPEATVTIGVQAPAKPQSAGDAASSESLLRAAYGIALAESGRFSADEVVLGVVAPRTPAAVAGLLPGDVVQSIDGRPVADRADLLSRLLSESAWGKSLSLAIRRGLPHPYAAHPRLDLFVGAQSPHPLAEFGCTVCHDGQGSATQFKFASHSPADMDQRAHWRREHGWFADEGWDQPMRPKRFAQSNCLRCHPDVAALNSSPRFPDPPAEKLVEGYNLVRQLGCFGCHEINGTSPAGRVVGPDMRLEPNYHEAALGLLADPALRPEARRLVAQVASHPEDDATRRQLLGVLPGEMAGLRQATKPLVDLLALESPRPGAMRKVGPSLRETAGRLDAAGLAAWIADPAGVRPTTRMPQMFGMHDHLDAASLAAARRFEPVEIRAMTEYLLSASQPATADARPAGVTEQPSAERGKRLFETQGCLACHRHADFPTAQSTVGPDLSHTGALLRGRDAAAWLAGWIRDPARHSPRTRMPSPRLEPTVVKDASSPLGAAGATRRADPAADMAAYLMTSKGWTPPAMAPLVDADLDELAAAYLSAAYPGPTAVHYVSQGIPATRAGEALGDAAELLAPITREKKLRYVGRRTIRKRGCFGCHDVPGMEDAQGIGPALSHWGNKATSQLTFDGAARLLGAAPSALAVNAPLAALASTDEDRGFYLDAILSKRREGFLWQKLRAPRSFDFSKTAGKPYAEHLRMGRFTLTDAQREAILTFVLGLSGEAPPAKYAYEPDARGKAIVEGRKVLDRYGCAECHVMEMERWTIDYDPARFSEPPTAAQFDFLRPAADPQRLAASMRVDRRGLCRAELVGMPQVDAEGKVEQIPDEDDNPQYVFSLWEPAIIAGKTWPVGGASVSVSPGQIAAKRLFVGGDFARRLYPQAVALAKAAGSAATSATIEAWGNGPPPLAHLGRRVEPAWLYRYLLDPTDIRPSAVLRMPRYTLAPAEAKALADYFAAIDGADFPYHADPRTEAVRRRAAAPEQAQRLARAMQLLTDRTTFCAKCHRLGDADPGGENRSTWAPDLLNVAGRIRPDALRRWVADPKSVLPYTAMPVNFPPDRRLGQELFPGSSEEQLDAVVDLLLYYREYLARRATMPRAASGGANAKQRSADQ